MKRLNKVPTLSPVKDKSSRAPAPNKYKHGQLILVNYARELGITILHTFSLPQDDPFHGASLSE